ncbi:MAG: YkgJ family cysteine cluster protein [Deltaproteobacteria bacterium]|nr:YkgJ family cysteine cluster protein [Deltaproteobacteria bacterium]
MFAKLLHLYQFVDQTMAMLFAKFPAEVRCTSGCTDCCNAVFDLSHIEASFLLRTFAALPPDVSREITQRCRPAEQQWQEVVSRQTDPSLARIRCPLLNDRGRCGCYVARPVNCRTYGVPTVINGAAHVCGLSNFSLGSAYPSLDLTPLQKSLYDYSVAAAGESLGGKRWPVAVIFLHPEQLGEMKNDETGIK